VTPTIVVGYDGSDTAGRALDYAVEQAGAQRAQLVVISVAELPVSPQGPQEFGIDPPGQMFPLVEPPDLEPVLAKARKRVEAAGAHADYVWSAGEPIGAIAAAARDRRATLVVVGGSHHRGRLARFIGLDVAAGLARETDCEVVAVD
jgi:nucleotide-binding universal stress UspA family protein